MFKKPENWQNLPYYVKERFLENIDLEYDPYESSSAEVINNILSDYVNSSNKKIIDAIYKEKTDDDIFRLIKDQISRFEESIIQYKEFLNEH